MFGSFGMMELLLILIIVMIVFGAGKLPQLGEGLGKAIKGFKKSVHEPESIETDQTPHAEGPGSGPAGPAAASNSGTAPERSSQEPPPSTS